MSNDSSEDGLTQAELVDGLRALGLGAGDVVFVQSAMRTFGPIAGGAETVVAALMDVLGDRGTLVVPDILANADDMTVSYFEWTQNNQGFYWPLELVHERLHTIMALAFNTVHDLMEQQSIDMRTAAYVLALNRIGQAVKAGGTHRYFADGH